MLDNIKKREFFFPQKNEQSVHMWHKSAETQIFMSENQTGIIAVIFLFI